MTMTVTMTMMMTTTIWEKRHRLTTGDNLADLFPIEHHLDRHTTSLLHLDNVRNKGRQEFIDFLIASRYPAIRTIHASCLSFRHHLFTSCISGSFSLHPYPVLVSSKSGVSHYLFRWHILYIPLLISTVFQMSLCRNAFINSDYIHVFILSCFVLCVHSS